MATTYTVTATRMYVRQADGSDKRYNRGDSVSGLSKDDVERFKQAGAIASAGDVADAAKDSPVVPNPAETSTGPVTAPVNTGGTDPKASEVVAQQNSAAPIAKPPRAGTVGAWRDYAVMSGQLTQEAADAKTRDELRDELN